ncbi:MAG: hypothetical protein CL728_05280 [Chloroflexi bacterium]|mgnify:CR=1 FL=1|nr:hypothetical protein [Chloroflexota bacterium]|tara:strand:+ start:582 stop:1670 length:1089 start_codon:yes stop_codon:yes gene_type:complete
MSPKKKLDYKDVVGKLMSEENITIVHKRDIKTASFDISNRILFLPEFVDVSEDVYDLLIGHEVSHALHTPERGWHRSTEKKGANFKTFLNVVEDARIEKMIQKKFPGLKSSFKRGYKELYDMDLFGIKYMVDEKKDKLLLIDRLNLYFKLGQIQSGVSFKKEEMHFVEDMDNLKTWKDVVDLAERLFEYCKEEQKEKQQDQGDDPQAQTSTGDITGEYQGENSSSETQETEDTQDSSGSAQQDSSQSDEGDEGDDQDKPDNSDEKSGDDLGDQGSGFGSDMENEFDHIYNDEEPISLTDKNFREHEEELNHYEDPNNPSSRRYTSECSLDLPVVKKEFFYDDWKKIIEDVKKWRLSAMVNGW